MSHKSPSHPFSIAERIEANANFGLDEAALISGRARSSIYRDHKRGDLTLFKVGRRTFIKGHDLRDYMAGQPVSHAAE